MSLSKTILSSKVKLAIALTVSSTVLFSCNQKKSDDRPAPAAPKAPAPVKPEDQSKKGANSETPSTEKKDGQPQDPKQDPKKDDKTEKPEATTPEAGKPEAGKPGETKPTFPVEPTKPVGVLPNQFTSGDEVAKFLLNRWLKTNRASQALADSVSGVEFIANDLTNDFKISLALKGQGKFLVLGGSLADRTGTLKQMESEKFLSSKNLKATGKLVCIGLGKSECHSMVFDISIQSKNFKGQFFILSRKTFVETYLHSAFDSRTDSNMSDAAAKFGNLLTATRHQMALRRSQGHQIPERGLCQLPQKNLIRAGLLESYEVIGSGSQFNLSFVTCDKQAVVIKSSLFKTNYFESTSKVTRLDLLAPTQPKLGSLLNIVRALGKSKELDIDPFTVNEKSSSLKLDIQNSIERASVSVVNTPSSGHTEILRGQISIRGKGPAGTMTRETFKVGFLRRPIALKSVSEIGAALK